MANKKLAVAKRKFTKQDGSEGTEWCSLGVLGVSQNGKEYLLLDPSINLAGLPKGENGMVMVGVFEDNNQGQNNQQGGYQNQAPQQQSQGQGGYGNQPSQNNYGGQQQQGYAQPQQQNQYKGNP